MKKESINPETIEKLKKKHPGMSRYIFSMTRKPDYYGIDLTQSARKEAGKKPKVQEHREKPCRLYVRLTTRDFKALTARLNGSSRQGYIEALILKALKEA